MNNKNNQVSIEPDNRVWNALENNKRLNNCNFQIVKGFISNKKLNLTNLQFTYGSTYLSGDKSTYPLPVFTIIGTITFIAFMLFVVLYNNFAFNS